ncbi:MAG: SurA N-terminal domain-containing protein [Gammaproteobacteria bacterium]
MLQAMHERISGILGWAIIGLIIITFALFGLGSYLEDKSRPYVAKVNDVEIPLGELQMAVENQRARMQQMMGESYDPSMISDEFLKDTALKSLIQDQVLLNETDREKMRISDQFLANYLQSAPALLQDGKFSQEKYQQLLYSRGMSAAAFENDIKSKMQASQLVQGFSGTAFVTGKEILATYKLKNQKRNFSYLTIKQLPFVEGVTVTPEEARKEYEENSTHYMEPERVKVEFVKLSRLDLEPSIDLNEADVLEYYEERRESLQKEEQRRASHILLELAADADEKVSGSVLKKAQGLIAEINAGADFAELAKKHSSDPGSGANGGDLGFFGRGSMVKSFEDSVFSLEEGQVSDPVLSQFGYHIIKLTQIQASKIPDFAEAKPELETELKRNQAAEKYYELFDELTNLSYENADSLGAVNSELDLEIEKSDWINRSGGPGIGGHKNLVAAIFNEDTLDSGNNTAPIEVGEDEAIVARVIEREPQKVKPFEAVETSIRASLTTKKARDMAKIKGDVILEKVRNGTELKSFEEKDKISFTEAKDTLRDVSEYGRDIVMAAFRMHSGEDNNAAYQNLPMMSGDTAVIELKSVIPADISALTDEDKTQIKKEIERMRTTAAAELLISSLKKKANIVLPLDDNP